MLIPVNRRLVDAKKALSILVLTVGFLGAMWHTTAWAEVSTSLASVARIADQLPCRGEFFSVEGCPAFVLLPVESNASPGKPWLWYAPTFANYPKERHLWMFRQFLEHGIAIAGVNVGESYGNPDGRKVYSALWEKLHRDYGLAERACLMPQSRGGLMLYNWAVENPQKVACIAGVYTVCDLQSYPGLANACGAYGMDEATLAAHLAEHNPIDRLKPLAEAGVPIMHIHGDSDTVVPLERNSGELARRYRALGGLMSLLVVPGKGHEEVDEFFQCQEFVDFILAEVRATCDAQVINDHNVLLKDFMKPLDLPSRAAIAMKGFMTQNPRRLPGPEGIWRSHFSCSMLPEPSISGEGFMARWECGDLTGRAIYVWPGLREMTGDQETGREVEDGQRRYLLTMLHPETGLAFVPDLADKAQGKYSYHSWDQSRVLRALVRWHMAAPIDRQRIAPLIARMIQGLDDFSDLRGVDPIWGDYACWSADEFDQDHKASEPIFLNPGYPDIGEAIPDPAGSCIEPLVMWAELTGDAKALDLAVRFTNGELGQHRCEKFSPDQKRYAGFAPDGSFHGHFHSKSTTLIGIAKLARYLADRGRLEEAERYARAARKSYDWIFAADNPVRGSRSGWFRERPRLPIAEMCSTADMIEFAEALAQCADLAPEFHDYANLYDDVESMTVNMIARSQMCMTPEFEAFLGGRYGGDASKLALARRLDGVCPTFPAPNAVTADDGIGLCGCCQYSGAWGLYNGWRAAISHDNGKLRINYFLNRRSPEATMSTMMPTEGKAEITVHNNDEALVRVPAWLQPSEMKITVGGKPIDAAASLDPTGHYVCLGKLSPETRIEVQFPLAERSTEEQMADRHYGLLWRGNYVIRAIPPAGALSLYP